MSATPPPPGSKNQFGASGLIATWFGSGLLPAAPGTWGSLAALPFAWAFIVYGGLAAIIAATIAAALIGIWASGKYAHAIDRHDPGAIVIDEVAGQWLATVPIASGPSASESAWLPWVVAFLAFRLFDITKPWPARRVEGWPEGFGIMADDIVAGVYAAIVVAIVIFVF